ncbi:MAG: DUF4272 domain-containing protein [Crocinitomicaceae bacterium]|nr:DUF4272 domain-containing protein [Crocinitomicaceae bacterium]
MFNLFKKKIQKHNSPQNRKERSENRLAKLGISYNSNLPLTIEKDSVAIRNVEEVSSKIICLWEVVNIASKTKDSNRSESIEFLKDVKLWNFLSPLDQEFLTTKNHSKQRIIDMTWRTEVLKVLYWSLNEISSLGDPIEDDTLVSVSDKTLEKYPSLDSFLDRTKLRSTKEILDESDFIYRLHWSSREHRRKQQNVPSNYNYSVIRERDFAFRWLTDPSLKWDEITLDT